MNPDPERRELHQKLLAYCCRYEFFVELLALLCARDVRRANANASCHQSGSVLVIKHDRFRGDIEILRQSGRFSFLKLPTIWPGRFYRWFYGMNNVHRAHYCKEIQLQQERYRRFLRRFLPRLFWKLSVKVLMNSGVNYKVAGDWVAASDSVGFASAVFHREGYMGSIHELKHLRSFAEGGRRFEGTALVLQTELQRKILIGCGFVRSDNSTAIGTLRFDPLFESHLPYEFSDLRKREWVTFFSFGVSTGFLSADPPPYWPRENESHYLYQFSKMSHIAVAQYAANNPDVKVMIKTKWARRWFDKVHEFLDSASLSADSIPNLVVTDRVDSVTDQIARSRVVVGYGSTTLLEAAITGIPVIVPFFAEIAEKKFEQYVCYPDIFNCFEIADGPDVLQQRIGDNYRNWGSVADTTMRLRTQAFEKYVSPCDGRSTERAERVIEELGFSASG